MHLYIILKLVIRYASILLKIHFLEEVIIRFVIQFPIIKIFICKSTAYWWGKKLLIALPSEEESGTNFWGKSWKDLGATTMESNGMVALGLCFQLNSEAEVPTFK